MHAGALGMAHSLPGTAEAGMRTQQLLSQVALLLLLLPVLLLSMAQNRGGIAMGFKRADAGGACMLPGSDRRCAGWLAG